MDKNDAVLDKYIHKRLKVLSWITLQHLDVPTTLNFNALDSAINHLQKIDKFKVVKQSFRLRWIRLPSSSTPVKY